MSAPTSNAHAPAHPGYQIMMERIRHHPPQFPQPNVAAAALGQEDDASDDEVQFLKVVPPSPATLRFRRLDPNRVPPPMRGVPRPTPIKKPKKKHRAPSKKRDVMVIYLDDLDSSSDESDAEPQPRPKPLLLDVMMPILHAADSKRIWPSDEEEFSLDGFEEFSFTIPGLDEI